MKLLIKSTVIMAIWGSMIVSAFAENTGTINFFGKVAKATCSVASEDMGKNVFLPETHASKFTSKNSTDGDTNFSIKLKDCKLAGSDAGTIEIKFTGYSVDSEKKFLKNTETSGAKGIGIGIYKQDSTDIVQLDSPIKIAELTKEDKFSKELRFTAKYVATEAPSSIKPGLVKATTNFTVTYE